MLSDKGNPNQAHDQSDANETRGMKVRQAWERPALRRLDASDAERGINAGADAGTMS